MKPLAQDHKAKAHRVHPTFQPPILPHTPAPLVLSHHRAFALAAPLLGRFGSDSLCGCLPPFHHSGMDLAQLSAQRGPALFIEGRSAGWLRADSQNPEPQITSQFCPLPAVWPSASDCASPRPFPHPQAQAITVPTSRGCFEARRVHIDEPEVPESPALRRDSAAGTHFIGPSPLPGTRSHSATSSKSAAWGVTDQPSGSSRSSVSWCCFVSF